jgi:hypothetical protein
MGIKPEMTIRSSKFILLIGAGFTHNFGAPLARDLWGMILGHPVVKNSENVKKELLNNHNIEDVYQKILAGPFSTEEKDAIRSAIFQAYEYIDNIVINWSWGPGSPYPVNMYKVERLINAFCGTYNEPGLLFTLNQDLFLEQHYCNGERPMLPGIPPQDWWFKANPRSLYRNGEFKLNLPSKEQIEQCRKSKINSRLLYIKLHGSSNWIDEHSHKMIIGGEKIGQIEQEPLLLWYFDIFRQVFGQSNRKLLIIGYSFGDDHINEIIANSVIQYGLKIYIISPKSHSELRNQLVTKRRGEEIWQGLGGHYPYHLAKLFPSDQSESAGFQIIQDQFFEGRIVPCP